jgi:hypothetical protein
MTPEDKLEAIEEMVVVGVPVRRACMGWARFQSLLVYLSGTETSRPAAESQHGGEGRRSQREDTTGPVSDQCISWFTVLAGDRHLTRAIPGSQHALRGLPMHCPRPSLTSRSWPTSFDSKNSWKPFRRPPKRPARVENLPSPGEQLPIAFVLH